ncbi:AcrR family transcriptional regulator [Endobacter medicaginis]|jgi:AcrR family transcriptional regulator|uniref:AcrR family transcriptional regulator n=1 Tax=Endobacter medicaginis TaxID=1181271 RepID=A0A839UYT4_9PROT|nr:TetR/AcrR family transcriptional regulator [Endobacter medicaginis]MBB3173494.1 AcrR family transcriptional regulator [Endobacter medicaginis]MCX5475417.1 TetR/AcrR family transcriptional regulator [Endobacter medicaginis]NVN31743.1 TetR/AcrR family transcriptional regulator [Endobacter medicaginis]
MDHLPNSPQSTPALPAPTRSRGRPRGFDRAAALARAVETFWAQGYEGASISVLTAAMGITAQSLYAAFGSKAELYEEALGWYRQKVASAFVDSLERESRIQPSLLGLLENSARAYCCPDKPQGCMIATALLTCAEEHATLAAMAARLRADMLGAIETRIRRAVEEGEMRPQTRPDSLARFIGALLQGMSVQARDGASCGDLRAMLETARLAIEANLAHARV